MTVSLDDLAKTIGARSGMDAEGAQKALEITLQVLAEKLSSMRRIEVEGFGTFVRRAPRKAGSAERIIFRPWAAPGTLRKPSKYRKPQRHAKSKARKPAEKTVFPDRQLSATAAAVAPRPGTNAAMAKRSVVLHYHLFKNAGTSIDELLRLNFGAQWTTQEFHVSRRDNAAAVASFISSNPHILAISSHTALLPAPNIDDVKIFPIVFIRHPIDRLRSAYEFERRQNANTAGARLAKMHDLAGYVHELLKNPRHRQIRNFQTFRLSHNEHARSGSELERAIVALEKLPYVGLVERFDEAAKELEIHLRAHFPDFRVQAVHRNAARSRQSTLADRLREVEATLGTDLYKDVWAANADDLAICDLLGSKVGI